MGRAGEAFCPEGVVMGRLRGGVGCTKARSRHPPLDIVYSGGAQRGHLSSKYDSLHNSGARK